MAFRNVDDPKNYIAVMMRESIDTYEYPSIDGKTRRRNIDTIYVVLLIGSATQYHRVDIGLGELDLPQVDYGVVDANRDGYKEVFFISASGGSGAYGMDIMLYNTKDRIISKVFAGREYAIPVLDIEITGETIVDPLIEKWLLEKARNTDEKYYPIADSWYQEAKHDWILSNGLEFVDGILSNKTFQGIPDDYKHGASCILKDNETEWISYSRGPVFCFEKEDDNYYVVYVPTSAYNSVQYLVSGKKYLWLGLKVNDGILAFNKSDRSLEVIRVEGFKREDFSEWMRKERENLLRGLTEEEFQKEITWERLSLDESRLHLNVDGSVLTTYGNKVVFINRINADEFQDAIRCSYNRL